MIFTLYKETAEQIEYLSNLQMLSKETREFIEAVANLDHNGAVRERLNKSKYNISRLVWEDTSRTKGSCWGKNISDMTLVLAHNKTLLPMIRWANFEDVTYDVLTDLFKLPVFDPALPAVANVAEGANRQANKVTTLSDFLQNITTYVPGLKTKGPMFLPRDVNVLASPQVCVVPLKDGSIDFAVQLYNYQSNNDPAVLTIMVSQQGVAVKVLKGREILYHNNNGRCAWLNAIRLEDDRKARGEKITKVNSIKELTGNELDANTILVIQVPLKVKEVARNGVMLFGSALGASSNFQYEMAYGVDEKAEIFEDEGADEVMEIAERAVARGSSRADRDRLEKGRGMDFAQVKIGSDAGEPYPNITETVLERDPDSPIRVTIQGYIVTDTADLTPNQVDAIIEMLQRMEKFAEAKGSLVTTNSDRLTEPGPPKPAENPIKPFAPQPFVQIWQGVEGGPGNGMIPK